MGQPQNSHAFDLARISRESGVASIDYHDTIESTNTRALALAAIVSTSLPLLVLADQQTAGRGRGRNRWWSGRGGLTFSLLLDRSTFEVPNRKLPLMSLVAGLAVAETIESWVRGRDVRLKWPNDVFLDGGKVSGILAETSPARSDLIVIGVGINVNNTKSDAPAEIASRTTSLKDVNHRTLDRSDVLISLLRSLFDHLRLLSRDTGQLTDAWRERCFLQGRTVQLETGERSITGVCQSIDDEGALLLYTESGIQRCFGGVIARVI